MSNFDNIKAEIEGLNAYDALNTIIENYDDGNIDEREAITLVTPEILNGIIKPSVSSEYDQNKIIEHKGAGIPGAAIGFPVTNIKDVEHCIEHNLPFILVLKETEAKHIKYMKEAEGVITFEGGKASHAAIIARQMGKPGIIGAGDLNFQIDEKITIDGSANTIIAEKVKINPTDKNNENLKKIFGLIEELEPNNSKVRKMKVKANADNPTSAEEAIDNGGVGIGAVRTEHMFFGEDRLPLMQYMLMKENPEQKYLNEMQDMLEVDFYNILKTMDNLPTTIRLLDAPKHEFLPSNMDADDLRNLAEKFNLSEEEISKKFLIQKNLTLCLVLEEPELLF